MKIIQTEKLVFSYEPESYEEPILKSLDIGIESGSFVAVLGHNGSGKSTFAKHLNGILLPTGGKVWIDGMDSADEEKLLEIRRTVGMVFQNPDRTTWPSAPKTWASPPRRSACGWTKR